ncbi:MAG TPA: Calx-beta domain-containing protein [Verrucomicrobiae bacterium]|nr:Calx-beta domain-containing protein [Verrucomicrobiae bacterium]
MFGQSAYTANLSQSNALITIIFSGSTDATASVLFSTSDGTATATVDYVAVSTTENFPAQVTTNPVAIVTNTVPITLLNNGVPGSSRTVNLALSSPTGPATLGSPSSAVLTIINNAMQQLQFAGGTFSVDDTNDVAVITVVRTNGTNGTVAVDFSTSDGSAKAGVDYTATNGTVAFADGVLTNTFEIPIISPPLGALETNRTVNLTLSNPTGGAALGSPIHAQLTIIATGPQVIELSAATYNVREHVGHAIITAIRFGDSSDQNSVDYATSDGTAINGVDYFSTSGTLIFSPGASQSSFSFSILEFKTFQSNKTVNVTLSNPAEGSLTQDTAVVTIVNDNPQSITFTNSDGDVVTLLLKFAGTMSASQFEPLALDLSATDSGSVLTIKVKKNKAGTGLLEIDHITGDGGCRLIDARDFDVVGVDGIQLGDYLGELKIHDLLNGAVIIANGSVNQNTSITAHNIDDGSAIALGSRLKRLSAARFGEDTTIDAPRIGSISIKGDKRNAIPGDFGGTITLSGDGIETNQFALENLAVSGMISGANITVANGSIGSISAFQMIDSTVFVGYTPDDPDSPLTSGEFVADLRLASVTIRSTTNGFENSDLAASLVGSVKLSSVVIDNGGIEFGVAASQHIGEVTVRTPIFHWRAPSANNGTNNDQTLGDFHVLQ